MTAENLRFSLTRRDEAKRYFQWQARAFGPFGEGTVIDHGAGSGALTQALLDEGCRDVWAVEPDDELFSILKTRFEGVSAVRVFHGTLTDFRREHPERVSRIVSSNVLEHILDDRGCLREMHDAMVPGGRLGLYLPAREELFGTLDSSVGHYRRYGRGDLVRKVAHAGFSIETCQYRNLPGVLPWFWTGRVLRRVSVGTGTVGLYDRVIWPLTEWFEDRLPMPYGLNLLLLGTRGADTAS